MDPITIWMSRYRNRPVQVFTGYLDQTPYFQLYPGTVTLEASCTLKRLLHTYWDPALPFSMEFMAKFGWFLDPNSGQMRNLAEQAKNLSANNSTLTDGSMGRVLYEVLTNDNLGKWDDYEVFIEALPPAIVDVVQEIYKDFKEDNDEVEKALRSVLEKIVGTSSQGSGGTGANASGSKAVAKNGKWYKVGFTVDPTQGQTRFDDHGNMSFAELLVAGKNLKLGLKPKAAYKLLGVDEDPSYKFGMPMETKLLVRKPGSDKHFEMWKNDVGSGQEGDPYYKIDLHPGIANALGVDGKGDIEIAVPDDTGATLGADLPGEVPIPRKRKSSPAVASAAKINSSGGDVGTAITESTRKPPKGGNEASNTTGTVYDAIVAEANRLDSVKAPYNNSRPPNDRAGYDCSSSCAQLLRAAGIRVPFFSTADAPSYMTPGKDPSGRLTFWNNDVSATGGNSVHIFATIGGHDWGTSHENPGGGPGWTSTHQKSGFRPYHITNLDDRAKVPIDANTSVPGGGEQGASGDGGSAVDNSTAAAFATELEWPSIEEQIEALALRGKKSLMNDKPLMPFVQQLCAASLRSFQSLPNGDFFAFFPDYFGNYGRAGGGSRSPYWNIEDIEILDGKLQLNDDALATHVYVVGDTGVPFDGINFIDRILSGGVVTIFEAFKSDKLLGGGPDTTAEKVQGAKGAIKFLEKYGARPYYEEANFVRSPYFEAFLAFQTFQLLWSRTFLTEFQFTFMPELFPGGIVSFQNHQLQCYIDSVQHDFDYEGGFTTTAQLSAPAAFSPGGEEVTGPMKGLSRGLAG